MSSRYFWFGVCFMAFFLVGCVQASYGPLLPVFRGLGVPVGVLCGLAGLHALGAMTGIVLAGRLLVALAPRKVLLMSCLPLLLGMLLLGGTLVPAMMSLGAFLTGLGFGGFDVGLQLVSLRFLGERPGSSMNVLLAGFGVGAFAAPLGVSFVGSQPLLIYGMLVGLLLVLSALFVRLADEGPEQARGQPRPWWRLPSGSLPFLALFFCYNLLEYGVATWSGLYLASELGISRAAGVMALFWGSFLASRLVFPVLARLFGPVRVILGLAVLAGGLLSGMAVLPFHGVFFVMLGFLLGPVFPSGIAWISQHFGSDAGRVVPAALLLSNLAGFVVAPVATILIALAGDERLVFMNIAFALANLLMVWWVSRILGAAARQRGSSVS